MTDETQRIGLGAAERANQPTKDDAQLRQLAEQIVRDYELVEYDTAIIRLKKFRGDALTQLEQDVLTASEQGD